MDQRYWFFLSHMHVILSVSVTLIVVRRLIKGAMNANLSIISQKRQLKGNKDKYSNNLCITR